MLALLSFSVSFIVYGIRIRIVAPGALVPLRTIGAGFWQNFIHYISWSFQKWPISFPLELGSSYQNGSWNLVNLEC